MKTDSKGLSVEAISSYRSTAVISDCSIERLTVEHGGVLQAYNCQFTSITSSATTLKLDQCVISNSNRFGLSVGGEESRDVYLSRSQILNSKMSGIHLGGYRNTLHIENCEITGNIEFGIDVSCDGSIDIKNSSITKNAKGAFQFHFAGDDEITGVVRDCDLSQNPKVIVTTYKPGLKTIKFVNNKE